MGREQGACTFSRGAPPSLSTRPVILSSPPLPLLQVFPDPTLALAFL